MPSATQQVNKELEVIKVETAPIIARAKALAVEDAQSYAVADSFLSRLVDARKMAKARIGRILDPIKEALKEAQGLFKEIDSPLEQAEIVVRTRMRDFKLEEARQARLEEEKREAAAEELRRQAAAKALAESKAKTAQMKEKLAAQRAELESKADVAAAAPMPVMVKAAGSTTRTVKVPQVRDLKALLGGLYADKVPSEIIEINLTTIRRFYKEQPAWVATLPGIEMVDDIQIVKR